MHNGQHNNCTPCQAETQHLAEMALVGLPPIQLRSDLEAGYKTAMEAFKAWKATNASIDQKVSA